MFIVQLHYKVDLSEVDKYLSAHREFLDLYYQKGIFLASGPMTPRTGGIIIVTSRNKAALEAILQCDPFYIAEIARYEIIEFSPVKFRNEIKDLIELNT